MEEQDRHIECGYIVTEYIFQESILFHFIDNEFNNPTKTGALSLRERERVAKTEINKNMFFKGISQSDIVENILRNCTKE